jgi:SAM-dependent methyltransferase
MQLKQPGAMAAPTPYDDRFFARITDWSIESARVVVPLVMRLVAPRSVVDVGCGQGAWLRCFQECGVSEVRGLDGDYVDRKKLLVDSRSFQMTDLARPFSIGGRYDLALCLEVAEHLPARAASRLVRVLTDSAPVVLFSAAVPGQGGTRHLNEQWPSYWKHLFDRRGFVRLDPIRRHVWQDERVGWWYRQNLFLFASPAAIGASPALAEEARKAQALGGEGALDCISSRILARYTSVGGLLSQLPGAIWRALSNRLVKHD